MDLDSANNIYIGGTTNVSGTKDIILVKYNSLGEFQWNLTCKIPKDVCCNDIIIDTLDNIYILGQVYGGSSDYGMWLLSTIIRVICYGTLLGGSWEHIVLEMELR